MKLLWRILVMAAVSMGGVAMVRIAVELLNHEDKKYIDV